MTQADSVDETTVELPPLIQRWVDTYNSNDLAGHVDLYTDDARIIVIAGAQARIDLNPDQTKKVFWEMETALDHAAPNRQVRVDWAAVDGAKVCIEATLRMDPNNPDADQPLVVHFSMDADGQRLVRDHTFIDPSLINSDDSRIEEAVRGYFSSSGPTHAEFVADTRRWLADDVVWIDRSNPDGVQGLSAVVEELERAKSLGIEYMSFEIYDLVVVGDAVLTRRNDRLHAADGTVLANLDMMGYNRVVDGKIAYGKDYHFETAAYDQTWGGAGE